MASENEVFIVEINANIARLKEMIKAVKTQTGDGEPFFCPSVVEGKPYSGHAHTFPPISVTNPDRTPINL